MLNATMSQQPSSTFDQGVMMRHDHLPQINKELNVDINTPPQQSRNNVNLQNYPIFEEMPPTTTPQTFPNNNTEQTNASASALPRTQPSLGTASSAPDNYSNNPHMNGYRPQQMQPPSNHQLSPNMTYQQQYNNYYKQQHRQQQRQQHSPYGSPSSSSGSYPSWPGHSKTTPTAATTHEIQRMHTQHAQHTQHTQQTPHTPPPLLHAHSHTQGAHSAPFSDDNNYYNPQQYTSEQSRSMYEAYHEYYNNYQRKQTQHPMNHTPNKQYGTKPQSEYMKYLIQQVRQLTQERNAMQQTISLLQKKIGTKKLLEEDFYSFLSRIEFPAWITAEEKRLCLNKLFVNETQKISAQLKEAKLARRQEASKNLMLETKIIELTDDIAALREYLEQEKHRNYLESVNHNKNLAAKLAKNSASKHNKNHRMNHKNMKYHNKNKMDYPPENIIIQNLIRTQIEFYFSDYNLKRDKRLLDQLCSDRIGFLKIDSVMNLTRVRQLSSHRNQVINSLKHSKFLSLTQDNEWVGRLGFQRPQEKQFPFRRTVFVFGLPMDSDEKYVTEMLSPFGKLSKVKFDHGPDTLDRLVAENMLKDMKVYKYRDLNTRVSYIYRQEIMVGGSSEYNCNKCNKTKQCDEGFYETNSYQILICLQCAAASAEVILDKCKKNAGDNQRMIELLCGKPPRDTNKTKTALAVFTSQRQASKCVYVRSRIAFDGCFTTHYHHYSKLKKEIALTLKPFADKLRQIPPRRVLHDIRVSKLSGKGNVYHLGATIQPLGFEDFAIPNNNSRNRVEPPKLHHTINDEYNDAGPGPHPEGPESLSLGSISSHSDASDLEIPQALCTTLTSSHTADDIFALPPKIPPKLKSAFMSDNNNKYNSPKLKKSSAGSLTAPVVGGSGEIYLMRAAYNKVNNKKENSSTHESFVDQNV